MDAIRVARRRRVVVDERHIALAIGGRIRAARTKAGLTQSQLAGDRYTKAYISALELGHAKPSMAALNYLAPRLGTSPDRLLADGATPWTRLEADLLLATGQFRQAAEAYEVLLEHAFVDLERASIQAALAEALCRLGRATEAISPAREATSWFAAEGRKSDAARAQYWLAYGHHLLDDPDEARRLLRDLLPLEPADQPDPEFPVRVRIAIAQTEAARGEYKAALAFLEEARGDADDLDLRRRGTFYASLARMRAASSDYEGAIRAGIRAHALLEAAEAGREVAILDNQLALAYLRIGNLRKAQSLVAQAKQSAKEVDDEDLIAHVTDTDAAIALAAGDAQRSLALADEAIALAESHGGKRAQLNALLTRAKALQALGRNGDASETYERAVQVVETTARGRRREVYGAWADALANEGRHADAYAVARRALGDDSGI